MLETLFPILMVAGTALAALITVIILVKSCWKIAGTNEVMIITGLGKTKYVSGGGKFVIPLLQKTSKMTLENIQVDFMSRNEIPTKDAIHLQVDAVANMSISKDPKRMELAASKFAGYSIRQIQDTVIRILEGNIREIISQTNFEDLIRGDKKAFSELVMDNVTPNLADLGIDLTTFNIQNFSDKNGVIQDLGIENIQKIKKEAQIAAAQAQAEVKIAEAKAEQEANAARVAADIEIARKKNEAAVEKAKLKKQADTELAIAEAAKKIEAENQRRAEEIATADANLARQEKQIELEARAVEITKRKLEAEIKEKAEAEKYAEEQAADARLYSTQRAAEAALTERTKKAEADKIEAIHQAEAEKALAEAAKVKMLAEAEGIRAQGEAEAAAIRAKAEAEAKGLYEKAEAMKQYGEAAKMDMQMQVARAFVEQLPAIAAAVGEGYQGVDKIVMLGGDSTQLASNIMQTTTQISEGMAQSLGIDLKSLMAGILGGKIVANAEDNTEG
jgi:flotillin